MGQTSTQFIDLAHEAIPPEPISAIDRTPAVPGRDPGCDIVIDDPAVSRRHAQVVVEDGEVVLVDLGSAAGAQG